MSKLRWIPVSRREMFEPNDALPVPTVRARHEFGGGDFRIIYSGHFVKELVCDGHDRVTDELERPAVLRYIRERDIYEKIIEAIEKPQGIADIVMASEPQQFQVLIQSRHFQLNMSAVATPQHVVAVLMKNAMFKVPEGYVTRSSVIEVNPQERIRILFACDTEPLLCAMVEEEIRYVFEALEDGHMYDLDGDGFQYTVEIKGDKAIVEDAEWAKETHLVEVL